MTIKQQGGIFGRNPSFNDVEANQGTFSDLLSTTSMVSGGSNKTVGSYGNSHVRSDSNAAAYNGGNLSFGGKSVATGGQYIFGGLKFMSDPASGTGWDTYASLYLTNADSSVSEKVFFKNNGDINPTGNVVVNSGKGIDFSATSGTGTSELFDDYEEGTWTPVIASSVGTITTYVVYSARYTKVGRTVVLSCQFAVTDNGTGSGIINISGFPFTNVAATPGVIYNQSTGKSGTVSVNTSATSGIVRYYDATYPVATGQTIQFSLTYSE